MKVAKSLFVVALLAFALASCEDVTSIYKPLGTAWTAVYLPGGTNNWLNDADPAASTAATKITTEAGYLSSWEYTTPVVLAAGNRQFKIVPNKAEWSGDIGWSGINTADSEGVQEGGGNIEITTAAVANDATALITVHQGQFDEENLVLQKPVVIVTTAE